MSAADLSGADLTGANLTAANLTGVRWDATTIWPDGYTPPADSVALVDR
jgi:hypothetical protein